LMNIFLKISEDIFKRLLLEERWRSRSGI